MATGKYGGCHEECAEGQGVVRSFPPETLRQRVISGKVELDCRSGPVTILTPKEEKEIVH